MNMDEFFAEAKRLNLRMLGTPEETRAALDLKDAEIERLNAALKKANEQAERFERGWYLRGDALERIERWHGEFPATGRYWDEPDNTRPMSYGACYGSTGERDFMRQVAREALKA